MKKILFTIGNMNVGGIQKSLLELLKALAGQEGLEIHLFCAKRAGKFLSLIPDSVKVLPENKYARMTEEPLSATKALGKRFYLRRALSVLWSKFFTKALPFHSVCKKIGKFDEHYDVAIAYAQPLGDHDFCNICNEVVLNCVNADKKVTFVHCDFAQYGGNTARNRKLYERFDKIAVVSESVGKKFADIIPRVANRIKRVYNCYDRGGIASLSQVDAVSYEKLSIVTVARLSSEKGIDRCIPVFSKLKSEGYDFEWHVVGGGNMRCAIERMIAEHGLQSNIILEGEQTNPYRFMKNADFLLLPSYHEAAPIVFDEAMVLGLTVLTTRTLSAVELVENRGIGYVCDNTEDGLYSLLKKAVAGELEHKEIEAQSSDSVISDFKDLCND